MNTLLGTANKAFQKGQITAAMSGYINALLFMPDLDKTIVGNIVRTRQQYLKNRNNIEQIKVVVCGWELAHNAAARAHTLADIFQEFTSDVEIVGSIFSRWGKKVWEPIRESTIPIHAFTADPQRFIEQAMAMVAAHPADVVHLSKPRAPNIIFGIFYKLLWGAKVIVDIDDEELSFVKAETSISLSEYLKEYSRLPPLEQLTDTHWTCIAVGLVNEFDAITVSNTALQRRYGGVVIGHARDHKIFKPSPGLRQRSRESLGILPGQKVVLFSGTPRPHKGLLEVANAIQCLHRDNIIFVIAGSFGERHLQFKANLKSISGVKYIFLENQPFSELPSTLAIADCCVLLQDTTSPTSKYQIPAKLSDALAMCVPVLVSSTEALEHPIAFGAVATTTLKNLHLHLAITLDSPSQEQVDSGWHYFMTNLSFEANAKKLRKIVVCANKKNFSSDLQKILKYTPCDRSVSRSLNALADYCPMI